MYKFIFSILAVAVLLNCSAGEWRNSLVPAGKKVEITLAGDSGLLYRIENRSGDRKIGSFLAEQLQKLTGFPVKDSAAKKILLIDSANNDDSYTIAVDQAGNIEIRGNVVNGVMAYLEEDCGFRFYTPREKAVFPGGKLQRVAVTPRSGKPAFRQRSCYSLFGTNREFEYANRGLIGNFAVGYVHTIYKLLPPKEFSAAHPEYYALVDGKRKFGFEGQICTSNSDAVKIVAGRVMEALKNAPQADFVTVSQNDSDDYCRCSNCLKIINAEGSPAGAMLQFVNKVAEIVGKKYPEVTIVTEAYRYTLKPPRITRPAENVVVRLCLNSRIANTPFHYVDETDDRLIVEKWCKLTKRLLVWDYMTNFRNYLLPRADMPVLEHNLRYYRDKGIYGVSVQSNYTNELGTMPGMRNWVVTKLCWNPDWNFRDLAMDYIYGHYGPAASYMEKYYDLLDAQWRTYHAQSRPGTTFVFSDDFYPQAKALLTSAADAVKNDPELARDLALEMLTLDYYKLNIGLKDESQTADYLKLLEKVKSEFVRLKIDHIMEGHYGKALKQLESFADKPRLLKYSAKLAPGTVLLPVTNNVYFEKNKVSDSKSMLGFAIRQKNNGAWDMQFRFEDFPQLVPGKYKVELLARAPERKGGVLGVVVGIYNNKSNSYALNVPVMPQQVSKDEYKYVNCGVFENTGDSMFFYTSVPPGSAFPYLYIDAVKFTPVNGNLRR